MASLSEQGAAPRRTVLAFEQLASSSAPHTARRISFRRFRIRSTRVPQVLPVECKYVPFPDLAIRPARNSRAAAPCTSRPTFSAAPHRYTRRDTTPAAQPDSPNTRSSRKPLPTSHTVLRFGPAGMRAADRCTVESGYFLRESFRATPLATDADARPL